MERFTPPAGVAPVTGVTVAGVPRAAGAVAAAGGLGAGGIAGSEFTGVAVVGRMDGIRGGVAAGAPAGDTRGGMAGGTLRGGIAGGMDRGGITGGIALGGIAGAPGCPVRGAAGGIDGGIARGGIAGGIARPGSVGRGTGAEAAVGALETGLIAAPGIGGVSFGNEGRGGDVLPVGAREPSTKAVAGVALGTRGRSTGAAAAGGVAIGDATAGIGGVIGRGVGGVVGGVIGRGAAGGIVAVNGARGGVTARGGMAGVAARTGGWNATGVGDAGRPPPDIGAGVTDRGVRRLGDGSKVSGAASASDSISARSDASHPSLPAAPPALPLARTFGWSSETRMTAPHTEHRARTPSGGTFAGSTLNTDWHSTHETFNDPPTRLLVRPAETACLPRVHHHDDPQSRRTPAGSWRSSSSPSRAHSPAPRG